jgi:UMF1 family MFS transporter
MDRVSTSGYAWGYIGSVIPFLAVIGLIVGLRDTAAGSAIPPMAARIGFVIVAVWWLLLTIPLLKNVQQIHFCPPALHPVQEAFARLRSTLSQIRGHRNAFLFLLAYFFYIDGVDTVITMSVAYGIDIGLGATSMILAILVIQLVAFPCALAWGRLAGRFKVRTLLQAGIAIYTLITLVAYLLPSLQTTHAKTVVFWILSVLVGTSMGGIQALSRSFFGKLIPPERSAEFFGFYNIFGKCANIAGPLLVGGIGQITGHSRYGVLSILVLFIIGSLILMRVEDHA